MARVTDDGDIIDEGPALDTPSDMVISGSTWAAVPDGRGFEPPRPSSSSPPPLPPPTKAYTTTTYGKTRRIKGAFIIRNKH
jgi:hypothetical protein